MKAPSKKESSLIKISIVCHQKPSLLENLLRFCVKESIRKAFFCQISSKESKNVVLWVCVCVWVAAFASNITQEKHVSHDFRPLAYHDPSTDMQFNFCLVHACGRSIFGGAKSTWFGGSAKLLGVITRTMMATLLPRMLCGNRQLNCEMPTLDIYPLCMSHSSCF